MKHRSKRTRDAATKPPERRSGTLALRRAIEPGTPGQRRYVAALRRNDVTICDGPAGTGKTFLAAGVAIHDLIGSADAGEGRKQRLIITRPAVSAREELGFLPGKLERKVEPYTAPVFEAIRLFCRDEDEYRKLTMTGGGIVEVVPLAVMRGRTFRDAWVILDEAQNATEPQMELFLSRIGSNTRLVIVGDTSQSDLIGRRGEPVRTGLDLALSFEGTRFRRGRVGVCRLGLEDCMRHDLIAEILRHVAAIKQSRREEGFLCGNGTN